MRALVCHAYGPIEALKIEDIPTPRPKAGEVLIRVGATGVSFAAMLGVQGKHQNKPPLPYVPGNEIAGHVVALGPLPALARFRPVAAVMSPSLQPRRFRLLV